MPRIMHFEHAYDDPETAAKSYLGVFGWTTEVWTGGDQPYWLVTTGPDAESPGINGGFLKRSDASQPSVVNTITVDDIDAAIEKVEQAGSQIVLPKMEIPGVGYQAYFVDPGGVTVGLHQTAEAAGQA